VPRAALSALGWVVMMGLSSVVWGIDSHMDPGIMPNGCPACHRGHGKPRSPMLPAPQSELCLSCHDSQTRLEQRAIRGDVVRGVQSTLLSSTLSKPFVHPMSDQAFSRHEPGVVTCTSCHSPHRGLPLQASQARVAGMRKISPRNPNRFEYELCESCHGGEGFNSQSPLDISRLFNQNSRSYHPVEAPSRGSSLSVAPGLAGREINCTDCHGNSDRSGPRGPHGSSVRYILRAEYNTIDGSSESSQGYALCYDCHDREKVLNSVSFPQHGLHIVDERSSCATCHNPHGSIKNRALIRFGEDIISGAVSQSIQSGQLAFVSSGPGSGTCYLTCHGSDHSPKSYGGPEPVPLQDATGQVIPKR
jgi:predicted CXXCH cytochrome family protein